MALNDLQKLYRRANRNGGAAMDRTKYARVFGNDAALRRNVLRACANPAWGWAIEVGTIADARVVESLHKLDRLGGARSSELVLQTEQRLGRKLTRSRAVELTRAYECILARKTFVVWRNPSLEADDRLAA